MRNNGLLSIAVEPPMTPGLVAVRTARSEASRSSNYNENSCAGYRHELESDTWRIPKLSHPHALFFIFKVTHSKDRGGICHVQVQSSSKRGNNQRKRLLWLCVPLGIDSDGKTSRADCPATPLRIVPGWPNRDTVLRSGGSRGGKNGECDYRLSPRFRIENGTRF
jgi:hypothetical protein